jgi:hypothetical protein
LTEVYTLRYNQINLTGVPRRMIIWVSEKYSNLLGTADLTKNNLLKTNTSKAKITNININYSGRPGILGDADEKDLFYIAKKNECLSLSYSQFSKHVGSYIALNFGEEIPLGEGEAPGSSGNPQLS